MTMNHRRTKEDIMIIRTSTRIAAVLTIALAAAPVHADSFEELASVGSAGRLHAAAGAFVPVFDESGQRTGEQVFLLHGGYPPQIDAEPVSDIWVLAEGYWQHVGDDGPAMAGHGLVAAADGRAWAVGAVGDDGWLQPMDTLFTFELRRILGRLEVVVDSVEVPGPAPKTCFGAATVTADDGRSILSVGGSCLGNPLDPDPGELWEYRVDDNRWIRRADLPVSISMHTAVAARDFVWVFGGAGSDGDRNEVLRYDLLTDSWKFVATEGDRPDPRRCHRAAVAGNTMMVFGGIEGNSFPETVDDVWQLNLDTLVWTEKSPMPGGAAEMTVDIVPRRLGSSLNAQVLIYGGVTDAWSFPYDLSSDTLIYTSDLRVPSAPAPPHQHTQSDSS
jgi:hypothetical protein